MDRRLTAVEERLNRLLNAANCTNSDRTDEALPFPIKSMVDFDQFDASTKEVNIHKQTVIVYFLNDYLCRFGTCIK